jgi:sortase A
MNKKLILPAVLIILALLACYAGQALVMPLSDQLIRQAWNASLYKHTSVKPWPWMQSYPVAELRFQGTQEPMVVMAGPSAPVFTYAPVWHEGTNKPGEKGISVIFGDRKLHFGFLKDMKKGSAFTLVTAQGQIKHYGIDEMRILDEDTIHIDEAEKGSIVVLSTDYPYSNGDMGETMRFVAIARELSETDARLAGL